MFPSGSITKIMYPSSFRSRTDVGFDMLRHQPPPVKGELVYYSYGFLTLFTLRPLLSSQHFYNTKVVTLEKDVVSLLEDRRVSHSVDAISDSEHFSLEGALDPVLEPTTLQNGASA